MSGGNVAFKLSPSLRVSATVVVLNPSPIVMAETIRIATSDAGIFVVKLGSYHILSIVSNIKPIIIPSSCKPGVSSLNENEPSKDKRDESAGCDSIT